MRSRDSTFSNRSLVSFSVTALLAVTAAAAQMAAPPDGAALDTSGNYQAEVRACMAGKTGEDQATCLKEARNAQADKKRGVLDNANGQFEANARARCNALAGEDRSACEARMMGYGNVSGSVAGGGVLREVETVVMPAGQGSVTVQPKTQDPVVLVPTK
jgi:hypothetical protein